MITFELNRLDKTSNSINNQWLEKTAKIFFSQSGLRGDWSFSLALVSTVEIKKWNRIYRGLDKVTDVLSFVDDDHLPDSEKKFLGEILICVSRAKKQAKEYGWSVKREMTRLLVHGLCHLLGYDHENVSKAKANKMFQLEDGVMNKIFEAEK